MSPDLQLERLLRILVDRFGAARSLGEVYATTHALRAYREGRSLTLADIAEQTGISKQNLSRWLKVHIDTEHAIALPHQVDGRKQNIDIINLAYACRHLGAVAEVIGCAMESRGAPRSDEVGRSRQDPFRRER
ncbi:MAG: hypothetical protein PVH91_17060 [Pseudomonadales bacterium]|jgi:hypothetical protein